MPNENGKKGLMGPGPCVLEFPFPGDDVIPGRTWDSMLNPTQGERTRRYLRDLVSIIGRSGNPDQDFFYLFGPMTGIAHHNFPRFDEVAEKLRAAGYNIISPAELDDPADRARYEASPVGDSVPEEEYRRLLERDIIVCSLPTCVGGIGLEGWENSRGALAETWVLSFFGKQLWEWQDDRLDAAHLTLFTRDERLAELEAAHALSD